MVKRLRNKFVIVTMSLLMTLFGGFLIINTIYANYWNSIEIVEMLKWFSDSGIFKEYKSNVSDEKLIRDIVKDESPIAGILLDAKGSVLETRIIGNDNNMNISLEVLEDMCKYKNNKKQIGKYYYTYSELKDGNILLVVMDSSIDRNEAAKWLGIIALILCGTFLLLIITFQLSRFVTAPAEESLLREKRFISDASHELKTPLGAISINAQALEMEYEDNLYIKNIILESQRMGRLIERLLTLSKFDEQEHALLSNVCLSDLCEEMSLTYESVAFEKKISYIYEIVPDINIEGNSDEIRQLLAILIDNAIKNTDNSGTVTIKCFMQKKHKIILVANTGKGISEEDLPHVFERFYTSDASRKGSGVGLGLAIAKSITERHKGVIQVKSIPNVITEFMVIF